MSVGSWPSGVCSDKGGEVVGDADQLTRLMSPYEDLRTKPFSTREKDDLVTFAVAAQRNCA